MHRIGRALGRLGLVAAKLRPIGVEQWSAVVSSPLVGPTDILVIIRKVG